MLRKEPAAARSVRRCAESTAPARELEQRALLRPAQRMRPLAVHHGGPLLHHQQRPVELAEPGGLGGCDVCMRGSLRTVTVSVAGPVGCRPRKRMMHSSTVAPCRRASASSSDLTHGPWRTSHGTGTHRSVSSVSSAAVAASESASSFSTAAETVSLLLCSDAWVLVASAALPVCIV